MFQFVETMCACNGVIDLIDYHNERLNRTRRDIFKSTDNINLGDIVCPDSNELCLKVRALYDETGVTEVTYAPYKPKTIHTLRLVTDDDIDYSYKSTDRTRLQQLATLKGNCDEILIVRKGLLTDTSYTNIAVYINGEWLTPRLPLLYGVRRAYLLDTEIIREEDIYPEDIDEDTDIMLFNGMMDFGTCCAHIVKR